MQRVSFIFCALMLSLPAPAGDRDIAELRRELTQMRNEYENRILDLERRLAEAELQVSAETAPPPAAPAAAAGASAFNPAISLVLSGGLTEYSSGPPESPSGFPDAAGTSRREGLSLAESELTFSANVDDWF